MPVQSAGPRGADASPRAMSGSDIADYGPRHDSIGDFDFGAFHFGSFVRTRYGVSRQFDEHFVLVRCHRVSGIAADTHFHGRAGAHFVGERERRLHAGLDAIGVYQMRHHCADLQVFAALRKRSVTMPANGARTSA